jgi:hypothetical protein
MNVEGLLAAKSKMNDSNLDTQAWQLLQEYAQLNRDYAATMPTEDWVKRVTTLLVQKKETDIEACGNK